jgi:hypothetical protein
MTIVGNCGGETCPAGWVCENDVCADENATALLSTTDCYTFASGCSEVTPGSGNYTCNGPCSTGTISCINGQLICNNQQGPTVESCKGVDDNCNGAVDDNWDLDTDPNHCGCRCASGFVDLDSGVAGCEYHCDPANPGSEVCDGFSYDYPYYALGYTDYEPLVCNGNDYDYDCDGLDDDDVLPTSRGCTINGAPSPGAPRDPSLPRRICWGDSMSPAW